MKNCFKTESSVDSINKIIFARKLCTGMPPYNRTNSRFGKNGAYHLKAKLFPPKHVVPPIIESKIDHRKTR